MPKGTAIVLDLDGNGIVTQGTKDAKVRYDWDGDGLADQTSWIGATEAFLFLDSDGNGTVTGASELSFWPAAADSASLLSSFDTNHDGAITAADADWANLKVWNDKNGNGVAEAGEILTLAAAGIRSLPVALTPGTDTPTPDSAVTLGTGSYTRTNGTSQTLSQLSLGYFSAPKDGLPTIGFLGQSFDRKAKKYHLTAKDGQIVVGGKHLDAVDSRAGGISGATMLTFKDRTVGMLSALVLDLDGNGVSLARRVKSNAWFDMDGDGVTDDTGWTAKGDGFLVIDRDNDGRITNGSELSFLAESATAKNSLAGLAILDSNGDHILDKKDARFGELKVWIDANGNGVSDEGELKTLAELGIASIDLNPHNLSGSAKPGENLLLATATFTRTDGSIGTLGDAALAFKQGLATQTPAAVGPTAPVTPSVPQTPGQPESEEPSAPDHPFRQLTPDNIDPAPFLQPDRDPASAAPTGLFAAAANQLASAMAAFGAPDSLGEIDMTKPLAEHPGALLTATPLH